MSTLSDRERSVLADLERHGTRHTRDAMVRFGIITPKAYGVPVGTIRKLARQLGQDHTLALALWQTGWYEARMLSAFVDEPDKVTTLQMDRWARDFDNWGITDTVCFHLFDRTPHAWRKIEQWSRRREEFVKRAGFALLASVALHDKAAPDKPFLKSLDLIESAAVDERNFVKKGVLWALRGIGKRNQKLFAAAIATAEGLAGSTEASARWIGKTAIREMKKTARTPRQTKTGNATRHSH